MRRAYKFRIYPNGNQIRELSIMFQTHRRLYNACLEQRKLAYEEDGISVWYYDQCAWFTNQRHVNKWYKGVNSSSAQATMRRLDKAFKAFFRRVKAGKKPGYPRFKAEGRFCSVEFPSYGNGVKLLADGKLRVQNVGRLKVKQHRPVEGTIKTVTLKVEDDKWYAIFSCDLGEIKVPKSRNPAIGIDVGIESLYTTSDGYHEPNPRYLKNELPQLRRLGRSVSRKKKGGSNRRKAVKRLRRAYVGVRNLRADHRHKTTLDLCRRYGFIAVERLNIKAMIRNRRLSQAIADVSWGGFLATLRYKAESAGVEVVDVDARGTSQQCSGCGREVRKELRVRKHDCPHCGLVLHRDENAARNILARGLLARTGPAGVNGARSAVA